jgi:hypothetical protein
MKKIVLLALFSLLTLGFNAQGQAKNDDVRKQWWEDFKAKRAAFLTEKIGLTPDEAQKFWPLYNAYDEKKGQLLFQMRGQLYRPKKDAQDYAKANLDYINLKIQDAHLEKLYYEKFKTFLGPEKLNRYYRALEDLARGLMNDLKKGSK